MKLYLHTIFARQSLAAFLLLSVLAGQAFSQADAQAASTLSATEKELSANITISSIKETTAALSSAEMQGRGTMQPGGDKAADWIAGRFQKLGLKPLGDKGTYLQKIDFRETVFTPETTFRIGDEALKFGTDYAFLPYSKEDKSAGGELVFIAYGLQSRDLGRDDLAGLNVSGKVVVMLDGPPANISKEAWEKSNAKFAILGTIVRGGASAVVIIGHGREKETPELIIDYLGRRQLAVAGENRESLPIPPIVMAGKEAAAKLFAKSQTTLKDALAAAETTGFKPVKLNQSAKLVSKTKVIKGTSSNVAGYIEGSDPKLKEEAVLFSAHYDAYGVENGKIFFGAADNALGTAEMMAVAESYSKMAVKPKRSMIFLAVTGEEYGLYGSKHWAKNPTWNIKKVAANLNLDGIGSEVYGPVKTMVGFGAEHSSLDPLLNDLASAIGINVIPDPSPEEKVFYRSDHYSFVERGVPALMILGAPAGDKEIWMKRIKEWEKTDYHQPGDVIQPGWAWEGAETVAEAMGILGLRISETEAMPAWLPTSRFAKLERGNTKEIPEEK
ncbi:MAG: M28 family peptidase [Pyrinomonadaceae bacterium]